MGFLKKIGKTLGKLPGSKLLTKPINKLAGKTPGLKGMPAAFGMGAAKPKGLAPSPSAVPGMMGAAQNVLQGGGMGRKGGPVNPTMGAPLAAPVDANKMGAQAGPPPMMEAPEAVPGVNEMQMPPMQAPAPMPPQEMTGPQEQMGLQNMAPQPTPQMTPSMQNLQQRMGQNRGPIGRRPSGIGPRFMG